MFRFMEPLTRIEPVTSSLPKGTLPELLSLNRRLISVYIRFFTFAILGVYPVTARGKIKNVGHCANSPDTTSTGGAHE